MSETEQKKEKNSKKALITEKITGRRLTPGRVLRNIVLALMMGAVFGLAAACCFIWVVSYRGALASEEETAAAFGDAAFPGGSIPESGAGETSGSEVAAEGAEAAAEPEDEKDGDRAGEISEEGAIFSDGEEAQEAETADEGIGGDIETEESEPPDAEPSEDIGESFSFADVFLQRSFLIGEIEKSLVKISATTTGTTWFESEVTSTETFSGVILGIGENEILILAPDTVRNKDSLKVEFSNGVGSDAYIKSFSSSDGLLVLAAESLEESPASEIRAVRLYKEEDESPEEDENGDSADLSDTETASGIDRAADREIFPGAEVIAAGSPLGAYRSYSFGDIVYVHEGESGFDTSETVIYADLKGDAAKGTFVFDYDGTLIGIASDTGEPAVEGDCLRIVSIGSLSRTIDSLRNAEPIPYIGLKAAGVTFDMRLLGVPEGCYITDVDSEGPAYTAGLKRGDIIIAMKDETLEDMADFEDVLRNCLPGEEITLFVMRLSGNEYKELDFGLTVAER